MSANSSDHLMGPTKDKHQVQQIYVKVVRPEPSVLNKNARIGFTEPSKFYEESNNICFPIYAIR